MKHIEKSAKCCALCVTYPGKEHKEINCFVNSTSPYTDLCVFCTVQIT
jgi:hypothetical protein